MSFMPQFTVGQVGAGMHGDYHWQLLPVTEYPYSLLGGVPTLADALRYGMAAAGLSMDALSNTEAARLLRRFAFMLGYWLGDGSRDRPGRMTVADGEADQLMPKLQALASALGLMVYCCPVGSMKGAKMVSEGVGTII
jgi:hypothetical protein